MRFGPLVGFLALVIAIYILWRIQQVVLLAFAAVVFATVLNRLVRLLRRSHIKRGLAVAISVTLILGILAGIFALIVPPFVDQVQQLISLVPMGLEQLQEINSWLEGLLPERLIEDIRALESLTQDLQTLFSNWFGNFFQIFYSTLGFVLNILLLIVLTIMLLSNPDAYRQVFILLFPAFYRRRVDEILEQSEEALVGWMKGILFNMTVITIFTGLGLWALGVDLPLASAILAGLLTFIPNLGPTISVIPPAAIALLDTPWKAIAVVVLYIVVQQVESNILTPLVMKHQVSLLPAITLLSQATFAVFFGVLGLFLALPIVVVGQVWLREVLVKDILDHWQRRNRARIEERSQSEPS